MTRILSGVCLAAVAMACLSAAPSPTTTPAEVAPKASIPCFPGAYYRKAVSSVDAWTGYEGVVTLPEFEPDRERRRQGRPGQFMDNASVYIGGWAGPVDARGEKAGEGREVDAGLSWEVVREPSGMISHDRRAFRPFWRTGEWRSARAIPEWYFYPGDTVRMRIETVAEHKLRLTLTLVARGEKGKAAMRGYNATRPSTDPTLVDKVVPLTVDFDAEHFSPGGPAEFKRVNAIDQVGREGKGVEPTKATATDAVWRDEVLLRGDERRPFTPDRFTDMRCPDPAHVVVERKEGKEHITIRGKP